MRKIISIFLIITAIMVVTTVAPASKSTWYTKQPSKSDSVLSNKIAKIFGAYSLLR